MLVECQDYDPFLMSAEKKSRIFNEIASLVMPKEGREYSQVCEAEIGPLEEQEVRLLPSYIKGIAENISVSFSLSLMNRFNKMAAAPDDIRDVYEEIREKCEEHYHQELRTGEKLSADEKVYNAHVRLYRAVSNAYIDTVLKHLPQEGNNLAAKP